MKYAVFFVLCLVALTAAAPQLLTYPGFVSPYAPLAKTVVTGPSFYNGFGGYYGGRIIAPGYYGAAIY